VNFLQEKRKFNDVESDDTSTTNMTERERPIRICVERSISECTF